MTTFEQQLLRLKQVLGLSADQDVAQALGMTKAAFSDRKRRDVFPEDKLLALAARNPGWHLDADWILYGHSVTRAKHDGGLKYVRIASQIAERYGRNDEERASLQAEVFKAIQAEVPTEDEAILLHHFRSASSAGRAAISATAASLGSSQQRAESPPSEKPPRGTKVQQSFHGSVGQVGGGDIINKGGRKR